MSEYSELAKITSLAVMAKAIEVKVEGMKARNQQREARNQSPAYDEKDFFTEERNLLGIVRDLEALIDS